MRLQPLAATKVCLIQDYLQATRRYLACV